MKQSSKRRVFGVALAAAVGFGSLALSTSANAEAKTVNVQLLNVSDWHGQLDPLNGVGGAAFLSTYFKNERATNPNTITFTAGDAVGATPPLSGFFQDEPTIRAMRLMGFDVDGLGNHNWDAGNARMQTLIDIAREDDGVEAGTPFEYLGANLNNLKSNLKHVAPYEIFSFDGVKVGVVSVTNPEAPNLVFPGNFGTITITDPVVAANNARAELNKKGVKALVLIGHMGVTGFDAQGNAVGPLIDLANGVSGYDVIAGDHTDVQYQGTIKGALVYENRSKGVTYGDVDLTIDKKTGKVITTSLAFKTPSNAGITPDPAIVSLLAPLRIELAAAFDTEIGTASDRFPRGGNVERSGEVAIGNLIADSMRLTYGTQLALTNGGGIRSSLPSAYVPLAPTVQRGIPPYDLVIGDVFTVLPFGNQVVTASITGAQLWTMLENGVSAINPATCNGVDGRFPQISGFRFTFACNLPVGSRVQAVELSDGTPIPNSAASTYTFATNDFVANGGDFYPRIPGAVTRDLMANVLLEYIEGLGALTPTLDGRITKLTAV